ncbi:cytochrome c oxidase subunit II [Fulvivirga sediminis]|uniref:Cytochrome c oxidase subunit 2 n=1 Tax=Fulvivirga sediminis TaxID=2803949 RepID=A0A937JZP7_9BACT|nr:cytochrome c oxidase subunit II [Fulvivirga sediminis]MBL3655436.1 cytochrome c oxidase subunit II [Fulvivirga sediminis]
MFKVIIAIGVVLLVIILLTLFRIGNLVNVVKGTSKEKVGSSNKINAGLLLLFMFVAFGLFFWYSIVYFDDYTLPQASAHAGSIDFAFWLTMGLTGIVFVITNVLLFVFSFKYQYKEGGRGKFYPDNTKLEILWTIVPAITLAGLVLTGLSAWSNITSKASDDAEVVEVMGYQFAWGVRYPGNKDAELGAYDYRLIDASNQFGIDLSDENSYDDFIPMEMHLPKDKEVLLKIRARDVIHSVFMPHFRVKMDAVPGMPTHFKFTPTKTTQEMRDELGDPEFDYFITCTEICGRGHFSMKLKVVVEEQEAYEAWKAEQATWLKLNEDYLEKVPAEKRELARIKAGIEDNTETEASL